MAQAGQEHLRQALLCQLSEPLNDMLAKSYSTLQQSSGSSSGSFNDFFCKVFSSACPSIKLAPKRRAVHHNMDTTESSAISQKVLNPWSCGGLEL